jgi:hypothetical protein
VDTPISWSDHVAILPFLPSLSIQLLALPAW